MKNNIPIILSAFGSTTKAMKTYALMDSIFRKRFSNHPIYWSYSSRFVRERMKKDRQMNMKQPQDVLNALFEKNHTWAVVQSLHITPGFEFDQLLKTTLNHNMRVSIGLPLLYTQKDFYNVIKTLDAVYGITDLFSEPNVAQVIVGHGTEHSTWTSYIALDNMIQHKWPQKGVYVSTVENSLVDRKSFILKIKEAGYTHVRLIILLLVAGDHFLKDFSAKENSWLADFESAGFTVTLEPNGLGCHPEFVDLFCDHIESALDIIPIP
ncbi:Sirohydrochlorin cobaltochelatase [Candidatus Magnetomorum sp. HK-1]|nr:Sirohydrochlorin cobaltochelatase [Candidatus Magnetomorum sp. HK-1]